MSLINCEIDIILTWSANFLISTSTVANQVPTYSGTDTKLFVRVVTLSTQDNAILLHQLKSCFKRTVNWTKYQSKVTIQRQIQYLDYLTDPSFQEVNRLFVLSFENDAYRTIFSSNCTNKRLQCYDRWTKLF